MQAKNIIISEQAKEIIIIGFGFDRDNLSVLGFPEGIDAYRTLKNMIEKGVTFNSHKYFSVYNPNYSKYFIHIHLKNNIIYTITI